MGVFGLLLASCNIAEILLRHIVYLRFISEWDCRSFLFSEILLSRNMSPCCSLKCILDMNTVIDYIWAGFRAIKRMYEVIRFIHPLAAIQSFSHTFPVFLLHYHRNTNPCSDSILDNFYIFGIKLWQSYPILFFAWFSYAFLRFFPGFSHDWTLFWDIMCVTGEEGRSGQA